MMTSEALRKYAVIFRFFLSTAFADPAVFTVPAVFFATVFLPPAALWIFLPWSAPPYFYLLIFFNKCH